MDNNRALEMRSHLGNLYFQYGAISLLSATIATCAAEISSRPEAAVPILGLWALGTLNMVAAEEHSCLNEPKADTTGEVDIS
ncbi:MAG: hypothetical protein NUV98_01290 [Candidatus Roizmanbacteria bacterium]|nr:hypothetical protein [Candidatus Roizmanbacteria bacterium]